MANIGSPGLGIRVFVRPNCSAAAWMPWLTGAGPVNPTQATLVEGQTMARSRGHDPAAPRSVPLTEAHAAGLGECWSASMERTPGSGVFAGNRGATRGLS